MKVEIEISDRKAREWNYFLGNRYGKRKSLKGKFRIAIMEIVSIQARKEVEEVEHLSEEK